MPLLFIVAALCSFFISATSFAAENFRLGIFAYHDAEEIVKLYQPLADHLSMQMHKKVELKVYDYNKMNEAVSRSEIEAVLTTPAHLIQLQQRYSLSSPVATLVAADGKRKVSGFGAAIITSKDNSKINTLRDLAGKKIAFVGTGVFVYPLAAFEMLDAGIGIPTNIIKTGLPIENVVAAVLTGRCDAGVVPAGLIENMIKEKDFPADAVKFINLQKLDNFPYKTSTRLYPEWGIATLPDVNENSAKEFATALFSFPEGKIDSVAGFTIPANYNGVQEVMQRLRIPPFDILPHFTLIDMLKKYYISATIITAMGIIVVFALFLLLIKRKELAKSERKFRSIVDSSPVGMYFYRLDQNGDLIFTGANPSADNIIKVSHDDLMGKTLEDAFPGLINTDIPKLYKKIAAGETDKQTFEIEYDENGVKGIFDVSVYTTGNREIAVNFNEITEKKKEEKEKHELEKQILQAQKLESLGVLAGGIAHDFNNILMAIIGNADLALMRLKPESPVISNLHNIERAASRAADLAKQMLAYSGKGKFVIEKIDLNALMEEMIYMLEVSISKKVILKLNPYRPLPFMEGDTTQIRQILMNMVINANEAIGERSGVISISTGCINCDRAYLKNLALSDNIKEGLYIYLEVADTGCGMDKDTIAKIFDPFFTTKFTGRGLGMAAVLGIVRGHKGAIKIYSEFGRGTTFKIILPASEKPSEIFNGDKFHNDWHGKGVALLVDDEESVRAIGGEMLKELGFEVITACDGREAIEVYKNNPAIVLVILDLMMPHLDGEECFRELKRINSEIKVIMSSGYNEQDVTQKFVGKGIAGFIQKPYKLSTLQEVIRSV